MFAVDQALIVLKMLPMKLFVLDIQPKEIAGWTVYHTTLSSKCDVQKTNIGYCPMLPLSAVDKYTVYTMMKKFQAMFLSQSQS